MSLVLNDKIAPSLFDEGALPASAQPPAPPVKSGRSRNRAAAWRSDVARSASYLMNQARTDQQRAEIERLYDEALESGPDFLHYRSKSAFQEAPKLGIDRNAYARILNALDLIERGTYRHCRRKGGQGIPRTAADVLKALLNLALRYGRVFPTLVGLARLANVCKQTVVNCIDVLELYGFVVVQRRVKRIETALGVKVVQDSNAYTIQEPKGLGALAVAVFGRSSESRKWAAFSSTDSTKSPETPTSRFHIPPPDPNSPVILALASLQRAMKAKQTP